MHINFRLNIKQRTRYSFKRIFCGRNNAVLKLKQSLAALLRKFLYRVIGYPRLTVYVFKPQFGGQGKTVPPSFALISAEIAHPAHLYPASVLRTVEGLRSIVFAEQPVAFGRSGPKLLYAVHRGDFIACGGKAYFSVCIFAEVPQHIPCSGSIKHPVTRSVKLHGEKVGALRNQRSAVLSYCGIVGPVYKVGGGEQHSPVAAGNKHPCAAVFHGGIIIPYNLGVAEAGGIHIVRIGNYCLFIFIKAYAVIRRPCKPYGTLAQTVFAAVVGVEKYHTGFRRHRFVKQPACVVFVNHAAARPANAVFVGGYRQRRFLPVYQVAAYRVPPAFGFSAPLIAAEGIIALKEKMVKPRIPVINKPVGIVYRKRLRGKMQLHTPPLVVKQRRALAAHDVYLHGAGKPLAACDRYRDGI